MKFRSKAIVLVITLLIVTLSACNNLSEDMELKVLQFNVWQEGTQVNGGFKAIVDEIERSNADLVMLSEVRNYGDKNFTEILVKELKKRGQVYYQRKSDDSNLISKYPIISHGYVYGLNNDKGSITKAIVNIRGVEAAIYSAHLDYTHYACYLPRGYSGITWKELPDKVNCVEEVLQMNKASHRDEQIIAFIGDAKKELKKGRIILLGGDFNEPSFKDWTAETKNRYDHNGLVIPWHCSVMLEDNGFIDAYRTIYPNPLANPGFTWPSDNRDQAIKHLTWTPKSDERDRIDYIFHFPDSRLQLTDAAIVGPQASIEKGQRVNENSDDKIIPPLGVWPSDHKALLVTYLCTVLE